MLSSWNIKKVIQYKFIGNLIYRYINTIYTLLQIVTYFQQQYKYVGTLNRLSENIAIHKSSKTVK